MTTRLSFALFLAALQIAPLAAASAETVAVTGVTAYTMESRVPLRNATIVMSDGLIAAVGTDAKVPSGARVVDGTGLVATPGFMNSASSLGLTEVDSVESTNDHSVDKGPLGAAFDVQFAINGNSELIALARADGLAWAIAAPSGTSVAPFAGLGAALHLSVDEAVLQIPRVALFVETGGESSSGTNGGSRSAQWLVLRQALAEARDHRLRARPGAPRDSSFSRQDIAAVKAVVDGDLPLVIGADRESDIRQAIQLVDDFGIRVIIKGATEAWRVADALAERAIPAIVDPSVNLPLYFDQLHVRTDNAALLHDAGVLVSFKVSSVHTSLNAGFTLREVAGVAVRHGMPYHAALAALTVDAARTWGIDDRYGTLTAGKTADLVLWSRDPFEPSSTAVHVFVDGIEVTASTRQDRLRDRYHPDRLPSP